MYTLEDYKKAIEKLSFWNNKFANDSSNNPNKYQAQIRDAGIEVRSIERSLKNNGTLEKTESEKINDELDRLYPYAKSKSIHELNGKKYQIQYFPLVKSRSRKTVKEWGHNWVEI